MRYKLLSVSTAALPAEALPRSVWLAEVRDRFCGVLYWTCRACGHENRHAVRTVTPLVRCAAPQCRARARVRITVPPLTGPDPADSPDVG